MILDLTKLNKLIEYKYFKVFILKTALDLLKEGNRMASVDLTDAYYSVPISDSHNKYLRFMWKQQLFEYQALPIRLSPGPCIFTKLIKPIFVKMSELGHVCFPYINGSLIMAETKEECQKAVIDIMVEFTKLGFTINERKSPN